MEICSFNQVLFRENQEKQNIHTQKEVLIQNSFQAAIKIIKCFNLYKGYMVQELLYLYSYLVIGKQKS